MATGSVQRWNHLVRNVRQMALLCHSQFPSDSGLLEAFLACRDQAAFELLVKRHGPMVLGVCKRVIGNLHDAEDAFQAVFLVLARKAGSVVPREHVGNWLYGVAYRTALHARDRLKRHRAHERQVPNMPEAAAAVAVDIGELHNVLDRELNQLPEKYRLPLVLCELEGRLRKEVAAALKIPEGTLSSRLATARRLLARRFARHGYAVPGGALAFILGQQAASAAAPALVAATVRGALVAAAGGPLAGLVSKQVIALSEGALKTMFLNRMKVLSILLLGVVLGVFGAATLAGVGISPALVAAAPNAAGQSKQSTKESRDDAEPLDGMLLLNEYIQKDLRLSEKQIKRIVAISQDVDAQNSAKHEEIEQLNKRIAELQQRVSALQAGIDKKRSQSLAQAAPDFLSTQAMARLRQIQRQQRSFEEMLKDIKIQRALQMNDEQVQKIETLLKSGPTFSQYQLLTVQSPPFAYYAFDSATFTDLTTAYFGQNQQALQTLRKLLDVLSPEQQKTLRDWIGDPYWSSSSWEVLRDKK
jgi:RNA polymerase sigma factor (sigma-70 family)